jgi:hypothetical protein
MAANFPFKPTGKYIQSHGESKGICLGMKTANAASTVHPEQKRMIRQQLKVDNAGDANQPFRHS